MTRHDGAVALITGAGTGIGRALAIEAAGLGLRTILVGRRIQPLTQTADRIGNADNVEVVSADITRASDRAQIMAIARERFGGLDILVNNAGAVGVGAFHHSDDDQIADLLAVNVAAPVALAREALPLLRRSERARIVNVGSMFGSIAFPRFAVYSATKFALRGLSDALRRELKPDGIGVTYAAPRATRTPAADSFQSLAEPMGMTFDSAERTASLIWRGALAGRDNVYPGAIERFGALIAHVAPGLLDRHLGRIEAGLRETPELGDVSDTPTA